MQMLIEHTPSKVFDVKAVAPDTFQLGGMTMRFIRDKAGKVVGLDYSNPVVSNIKFVRLSDR